MKKLAIDRKSFHGQRIEHCLAYGLPLNILEAFGRAARRMEFASHEDKRAYFILKAAYLFTTADRAQVALFQRLSRGAGGAARLTAGTSLFCGLTPDTTLGKSFEEQILAKVTAPGIREVRLLGQGVSVRENITYLLTTLEVVMERRRSLTVNSKTQHFLGFVPVAVAAQQIGRDAALDRHVLAYLRGKPFDTRMFIPSAIDCTVREVYVAGIDIHRFSLLPNAEQVLKYITLQVLVRRTMEDVRLEAHTIQTGDGCFVVFERGDPHKVLQFCLELQQRVGRLAARGRDPGELMLRYGLHFGPVYKVRDYNQQVNFIGDGMNYCARLLDVREADVLLVSADFRRRLRSGRRPVPVHLRAGRMRVKHKAVPDLIYRCDLGVRTD